MKMKNPGIAKMVVQLSVMIAFFAVVVSCSDDEDERIPVVSFDSNEIMVPASDASLSFNINVLYSSEVSELVVQKKLDGVVAETIDVDVADFVNDVVKFSYDLKDEDYEATSFIFSAQAMVDGIVVSTRDMIVNIEFALADYLVRYDWALVSHVIESDSKDALADERKDDIYRFNADGSYAVDFGAVNWTWDGLTVFCSWEIDETGDVSMLIVHNFIFDWNTWLGVQNDVEYEIVAIDKDQLVIKGEFDLTGIED